MRLLAGEASGAVRCELTLESGEVREWSVPAEELSAPSAVEIEGLPESALAKVTVPPRDRGPSTKTSRAAPSSSASVAALPPGEYRVEIGEIRGEKRTVTVTVGAGETASG